VNSLIKANKKEAISFLGVCSIISIWMLLITHSHTHITDVDIYGHQSILLEGRLGEVTYPLWHYVTAFFYFVLHLSIEKSSSLACACFAGLYAAVIWIYFYKTLKNAYSPFAIGLMTLVLCVVQPLYWECFFPQMQIGRTLTNSLINPTQNAMRPFALLTVFCAVELLYGTEEGDVWEFGERRISKSLCLRLLMALSALLSVLAKPSFVQVFYFTFALALLVKLVKSKGAAFKSCFLDGCSLLPSLVPFLLSFFTYFGNPSSEHSEALAISFLEIWSCYTDSVALSILAAVAFPLAALLFLGKRAIKYRGMMLSWIMTAIGIVQYMFIMETGDRQFDGNFSWGYQIGTNLLWVFAMEAFFKENPFARDQSKYRKVLAGAALVLITWHFFSGFYDTYVNFGRNSFA
jgi:hypothetical protein